MIGRFLGGLLRLPGAVWGATAGRLFSRAPRERSEPVPLAVREEPQGVFGITFRATMVVVAVGLALVTAYQLRLLLILIFLAILLAAGVYGLVYWLERHGLARIFAVITSFAALLGGLALALFLIFPPLVRQAVAFGENLPSLVDELRQGAVAFIDGIAGAGRGEELVGTLTDGAQDALPELGSLVSVPLTFVGIVANLFVTVLLAALLLLERDRIGRWALEFVDDRDHEIARKVVRDALLRLGAYVRGQLLVMGVIGVGSALGMVVVGLFVNGEPLPFAIPLGAISFITAAIPMAGAFIAAVPIILVALIVSPFAALLMGGWLVVLQQLEGSLITPIVQSRAVSLSAVAVLLGVIAGTSIAGVVGGIIAIPLVAVADVVLREIFFPLRRRSAERRGRTEQPAL